MISKIIIIVAAITTVALAQIYRGPHPAPKRAYEELDDDKYPPHPYNFAYDSKNDYGATQFRKETGDSNGRVTGSYGYRDELGVERIVEYVADENGYRANVKTNEPGTDNKSPANIELEANPLQIDFEPMTQRYTARAASGYASHGQPQKSENSAPQETYAAPRQPAPAAAAPAGPRHRTYAGPASAPAPAAPRRHPYPGPGPHMPYHRPMY